MPPPVVCYICGRNFGRSSISLHIPNCKKKWENEQSKLPRNERKPVPSEPGAFQKILKGDIRDSDLQEYNDQAFEDYNKKALDECPNCKRTFNPKSLEVHLRSCKEPRTQSKSPIPKPATKVNYPDLKSKNRTRVRNNNEDSPTTGEIIQMIRTEKAFESLEIRQELANYIHEITDK